MTSIAKCSDTGAFSEMLRLFTNGLWPNGVCGSQRYIFRCMFLRSWILREHLSDVSQLLREPDLKTLPLHLSPLDTRTCFGRNLGAVATCSRLFTRTLVVLRRPEAPFDCDRREGLNWPRIGNPMASSKTELNTIVELPRAGGGIEWIRVDHGSLPHPRLSGTLPPAADRLAQEKPGSC